MVSLHPTKNCWTLETFEEMINQKWNENARQSFLNYNNSLKATYWSAYTQQKIVELCKYLRKWLTRNEMKILDDLKITSSKKNKSYLIISDSKHILIFLSLWIMGPFARLFSFLPSCKNILKILWASEIWMPEICSFVFGFFKCLKSNQKCPDFRHLLKKYVSEKYVI